MTNTPIEPSPATILSEFMRETERTSLTRAQNIQIGSILMGDAWVQAQTELLESDSEYNGALASATLNQFQEAGRPLGVRIDEKIGNLAAIGKDATHAYILLVEVDGAPSEHNFGEVAIVDHLLAEHQSRASITRTGHIKTGSIIEQSASYTIPTVVKWYGNIAA